MTGEAFIGIVALTVFVFYAVAFMWQLFLMNERFSPSENPPLNALFTAGTTTPLLNGTTALPPSLSSASKKPAVFSSSPFTPTTVTNNNNLKWGAYTGWENQSVRVFEQLVGRPDIVAFFVHFGNDNEFPNDFAGEVKANGQTLAIFWEYTNYNITSVNQPKYSYDAILRGDWDTYLRSFAVETKAYGGPVVLIPFSEMNGDWFPWAGTKNGNTPEKAILAYRHVHDMFSDVPNVKFGWAVNQKSAPDTSENSIARYYPGSAYVDYVGVDGFNQGGGQDQSFDELFGNALSILSSYNKPIYIFSMGTAEGPNKAAWITDAFTVQIPKYPNIVGWIWFNENKERDWRVNSNTKSLEAFKSILPNN